MIPKRSAQRLGKIHPKKHLRETKQLWIAASLVSKHLKSNTEDSEEVPPGGRGHSGEPTLPPSFPYLMPGSLPRAPTPARPGPPLLHAPTGLSRHTAGPGQLGAGAPEPREAPRLPLRTGCGTRRSFRGPAAAPLGGERRGRGRGQAGPVTGQFSGGPAGPERTDLVEAALGREDGDVPVEAGAGAAGHGGSGARRGELSACRAPQQPQAPPERFRVTRTPRAGAEARAAPAPSRSGTGAAHARAPRPPCGDTARASPAGGGAPGLSERFPSMETCPGNAHGSSRKRNRSIIAASIDTG